MLPERLISFFNNPESYPHHPESVQHIQTHISHVFIASPYVYKIKKPLNLDFLDFSSLEKRKYYCEREVELNRRLCEEIYLGVVEIVRVGEDYHLEAGEENAEVVEYAVKMKQLERKNFLIGKVKEGKFRMDYLEKAGEKLVPFYQKQTPDKEILKYGHPDVIRVNTDENFEQTRKFISDTIDQVSYKAIKRFTDEFLKRGVTLFEKRIDQKRIVDGHGDLHLEHINITDGRVCIYDCIEFNNRFRYQDIAADLAFLAMDLDFYGLRHAGRVFISDMADNLDDPDMEQMAEFYKCYRAYVRGKIKSFQSDDEEVPENERERAAKKASKYFSLSLTYALIGSKPMVLIFMGKVASGKSTLASGLADLTGLPYYSTDVTRKKLAGVKQTERLSEKEKEQLYRPEMSEQTYNTLLENAMNEKDQGKSVILDGTFGNSKSRKQWIEFFESNGIRYLFVEAIAPESFRKQRLQARSHLNEVVSDARIEDMEMLDRKYDEPANDFTSPLIKIKTDHALRETMDKLCEKLTEYHLSEELML